MIVGELVWSNSAASLKEFPKDKASKNIKGIKRGRLSKH